MPNFSASCSLAETPLARGQHSGLNLSTARHASAIRAAEYRDGKEVDNWSASPPSLSRTNGRHSAAPEVRNLLLDGALQQKCAPQTSKGSRDFADLATQRSDPPEPARQCNVVNVNYRRHLSSNSPSVRLGELSAARQRLGTLRAGVQAIKGDELNDGQLVIKPNSSKRNQRISKDVISPSEENTYTEPPLVALQRLNWAAKANQEYIDRNAEYLAERRELKQDGVEFEDSVNLKKGSSYTQMAVIDKDNPREFGSDSDLISPPVWRREPFPFSSAVLGGGELRQYYNETIADSLREPKIDDDGAVSFTERPKIPIVGSRRKDRRGLLRFTTTIGSDSDSEREPFEEKPASAPYNSGAPPLAVYRNMENVDGSDLVRGLRTKPKAQRDDTNSVGGGLPFSPGVGAAGMTQSVNYKVNHRTGVPDLSSGDKLKVVLNDLLVLTERSSDRHFGCPSALRLISGVDGNGLFFENGSIDPARVRRHHLFNYLSAIVDGKLPVPDYFSGAIEPTDEQREIVEVFKAVKIYKAQHEKKLSKFLSLTAGGSSESEDEDSLPRQNGFFKNQQQQQRKNYSEEYLQMVRNSTIRDASRLGDMQVVDAEGNAGVKVMRTSSNRLYIPRKLPPSSTALANEDALGGGVNKATPGEVSIAYVPPVGDTEKLVIPGMGAAMRLHASAAAPDSLTGPSYPQITNNGSASGAMIVQSNSEVGVLRFSHNQRNAIGGPSKQKEAVMPLKVIGTGNRETNTAWGCPTTTEGQVVMPIAPRRGPPAPSHAPLHPSKVFVEEVHKPSSVPGSNQAPSRSNSGFGTAAAAPSPKTSVAAAQCARIHAQIPQSTHQKNDVSDKPFINSSSADKDESYKPHAIIETVECENTNNNVFHESVEASERVIVPEEPAPLASPLEEVTAELAIPFLKISVNLQAASFSETEFVKAFLTVLPPRLLVFCGEGGQLTAENVSILHTFKEHDLIYVCLKFSGLDTLTAEDYYRCCIEDAFVNCEKYDTPPLCIQGISRGADQDLLQLTPEILLEHFTRDEAQAENWSHLEEVSRSSSRAVNNHENVRPPAELINAAVGKEDLDLKVLSPVVSEGARVEFVSRSEPSVEKPVVERAFEPRLENGEVKDSVHPELGNGAEVNCEMRTSLSALTEGERSDHWKELLGASGGDCGTQPILSPLATDERELSSCQRSIPFLVVTVDSPADSMPENVSEMLFAALPTEIKKSSDERLTIDDVAVVHVSFTTFFTFLIEFYNLDFDRTQVYYRVAIEDFANNKDKYQNGLVSILSITAGDVDDLQAQPYFPPEMTTAAHEKRIDGVETKDNDSSSDSLSRLGGFLQEVPMKNKISAEIETPPMISKTSISAISPSPNVTDEATFQKDSHEKLPSPKRPSEEPFFPDVSPSASRPMEEELHRTPMQGAPPVVPARDVEAALSDSENRSPTLPTALGSAGRQSVEQLTSAGFYSVLGTPSPNGRRQWQRDLSVSAARSDIRESSALSLDGPRLERCLPLHSELTEVHKNHHLVLEAYQEQLQEDLEQHPLEAPQLVDAMRAVAADLHDLEESSEKDDAEFADLNKWVVAQRSCENPEDVRAMEDRLRDRLILAMESYEKSMRMLQSCVEKFGWQ